MHHRCSTPLKVRHLSDFRRSHRIISHSHEAKLCAVAHSFYQNGTMGVRPHREAEILVTSTQPRAYEPSTVTPRSSKQPPRRQPRHAMKSRTTTTQSRDANRALQRDASCTKKTCPGVTTPGHKIRSCARSRTAFVGSRPQIFVLGVPETPPEKGPFWTISAGWGKKLCAGSKSRAQAKSQFAQPKSYAPRTCFRPCEFWDVPKSFPSMSLQNEKKMK